MFKIITEKEPDEWYLPLDILLEYLPINETIESVNTEH